MMSNVRECVESIQSKSTWIVSWDIWGFIFIRNPLRKLIWGNFFWGGLRNRYQTALYTRQTPAPESTVKLCPPIAPRVRAAPSRSYLHERAHIQACRFFDRSWGFRCFVGWFDRCGSWVMILVWKRKQVVVNFWWKSGKARRLGVRRRLCKTIDTCVETNASILSRRGR